MNNILKYTLLALGLVSLNVSAHGASNENIIDNLIVSAANDSYNVQLCTTALSINNKPRSTHIPSYNQLGTKTRSDNRNTCDCFKHYSENVAGGSLIDRQLVYINAVHYMLDPSNNAKDIKKVEGVYSNYQQQNKDFKNMIGQCN